MIIIPAGGDLGSIGMGMVIVSICFDTIFDGTLVKLLTKYANGEKIETPDYYFMGTDKAGNPKQMPKRFNNKAN